MHDSYKKQEIPKGTNVECCPVCGADAEIWQFSEDLDSPTNKVVMCSNGGIIGPQGGGFDEGCLLYMPPNGFYQATMREAVKYWNAFAVALISQRVTRVTDEH